MDWLTSARTIPLEHGKPLVFGPDGASCVIPDSYGGLRIAETNQVQASQIVVHDARVHHTTDLDTLLTGTESWTVPA